MVEAGEFGVCLIDAHHAGCVGADALNRRGIEDVSGRVVRVADHDQFRARIHRGEQGVHVQLPVTGEWHVDDRSPVAAVERAVDPEGRLGDEHVVARLEEQHREGVEHVIETGTGDDQVRVGPDIGGK